ncbi:hypothetical protein ROA7745_04628 [Roseovarius aestuarii]|uniref:Uncharacterized protein n=1 Tax=Roseovarius aestuarii TaxID=475083 RepID=A0A1X7BYS4_9RHOB|nr:hypothetical protein ROA7745_04628 [Roseovarius aestuarii]
MTGIAQILIVARGAGQSERVVPPTGIAHDLDQRLLIAAPVFRKDARQRVQIAHQRARRCGIDLALKTLVEGPH